MKTSEIIKVTANAAKRLSQIAAETKSNKLIVSVKGGGCNGYKYNIQPIENPSTYLEFIKRDGFDLYICDYSIMHLWGTTIDWKKDIMGETFHFQNPNMETQCGCGTSFTSKADSSASRQPRRV